MKLDLHGVKHEDVRRLVDVFLWDNMQKKTLQVEIITGNSEKMKNLVMECIAEYGMTAETGLLNTGTLKVDLQ